MSKYLFLFTIGPVQSFIVQARKLRDLYSGSKILSDLIDFAINQVFLKNEKKENIIFPYIEIESKPNRFLGILENSNPNEFGKNLEKEVREKFIELSLETLKEVNKNPNNSFLEKFKNQLNDFLNINWVSIPIDESNYLESYSEIEKFLASIKNIKEFNQFDNNEKYRKCSLSGERDALVFFKSGQLPAYSYGSNIRVARSELLENEGLSAISFVKRFYEREHFPSISEICAMNILPTLKENKKDLYDFFEDETDFQLCFEENLSQDYFRKNFIDCDLDEAKKKNEELNTFLKGQEEKLSKYYAVIQLDGDSMGKWLSGEFLEDKKKLKEFHSYMSYTLGEFAKSSREELNYPKGKTIYAGGDDFLGFINLTYIFDVLKNLRYKFSEFTKPLSEYTNNKEMTFSAGIVIAHYKAPLSQVLMKVREAEKYAKDHKNKNSFCISVLKHSGEISKARYEWKINDEFTTHIMKYISYNLSKDYFSDTFISYLERELISISDKQKGTSKSQLKDELIKSEIERLVNRGVIKDNIKGIEERLKKEIIESFSNKVYELYKNSNTISNFLNTLDIIQFLKREVSFKEVSNVN